MRSLFVAFCFFLSLHSVKCQSNFENHIGLSVSQFVNISDRYRTENDILNVELLSTKIENSYSIGFVYNLDYKRDIFFLRTGLSVYYNKIESTILLDHSVINEIPLYIGIEYRGISLYTGISHNLSFFKFLDPSIFGEQFKDDIITEENCSCNLKKYNLLLRAGAEYTLKEKFNIGFLYTLSPGRFEFVDAVGHKGYSRNSNIYLTYQF